MRAARVVRRERPFKHQPEAECPGRLVPRQVLRLTHRCNAENVNTPFVAVGIP